MKNGLFLILVLIINNSFACINDYGCKYGDKCIKAKDSISPQGICVTPLDQYGYRDYNQMSQSNRVHEVKSCQFNTDCEIGFSCYKQNSGIYGICMKIK